MSGNFWADGDEPIDIPPSPSRKKRDKKTASNGNERPAWKAKWQMSDTGSPLPNLVNTLVTLRNHPPFKDILAYDEMARSVVVLGLIPATSDDPAMLPRVLRDCDLVAIQEEMQVQGLRRAAKPTVQDAVHLHADQHRFHPLRDYLGNLEWDGIERIDTWLSYYLGCEPEPGLPENEAGAHRIYCSQIGRLFLIAMIARVLRPGCKADYMLILEGPQGALKSSACKVLAGEWFSDSLPDLSRGDVVRLSMHLRGKWLIEIAEMSSFSAAETSTLKQFITQTEERYTPLYGRNEVIEPRQCLFIGSTNEATYLRDATGARRFWPVKVGHIDLESLKADRDQLLAEAVALFKSGARWWPDAKFEAKFIAPEQAARFHIDPWQEAIEAWITRNARHRVTINEVLRDVIGMNPQSIGTREQRRVSAILSHMNWVAIKSDGKRFYERKDVSREPLPLFPEA